MLSDETHRRRPAVGFGAASVAARASPLVSRWPVPSAKPPSVIPHAATASSSACPRRPPKNAPAPRRSPPSSPPAFRRPVTDTTGQADAFFESGRREIGDFDGGVQELVTARAVQPGLPVSHHPAARRWPDQPQQLTALELASRLSFFLWSDLPDDELLQAGHQRQADRIRPCTRRAGRAHAGGPARRRAGRRTSRLRWLNLDDLKASIRIRGCSRGFNAALREDFATEIRLFLAERAAREPQRARPAVGRLHLPQRAPGAALRHAGRARAAVPAREARPTRTASACSARARVLLRTSYGDRTSPVLRGAWVLEKLHRHAAHAAAAGRGDRPQSRRKARRPPRVRARLEVHRTDQELQACHGVIDPLGLALENFDVIGAWRTVDTRPARRIDASTVLPSGVPGERRRASCATTSWRVPTSSCRPHRAADDVCAGREVECRRHAAGARRSCASRRSTTTASSTSCCGVVTQPTRSACRAAAEEGAGHSSTTVARPTEVPGETTSCS